MGTEAAPASNHPEYPAALLCLGFHGEKLLDFAAIISNGG